MDPDALAGMVFTLILIGMIGGFILLVPVSRRLGQLLEFWLQEKQGVPSRDELAQLRKSIGALEEELSSLSERQQFTERLLESRHTTALPAVGEKSSGRP
jgi:hypothetical protein